MSVYLVRHGKAGSRRKWEGSDDLRPLTEAGRRQAEKLADWLEGEGITAIVSSPSVRCRQTVEPLAERLRLPVDLSDALAEGAPLSDALRLIEKMSEEQSVLCTHGDVFEEVIAHAERHGARCEEGAFDKGGTWVLELEAGAIIAARYVPPGA